MIADAANKGSVLITGATGFVGSHLVRALLRRHYDIYAITRQPQKLVDVVGRGAGDRFAILTGDLLQRSHIEILERELAAYVKGFDYVIHLVGGGPLTSNNAFSKQITDLNYTSTANLLDILDKARKLDSVSLFVYFSSLAAMGMPTSESTQIVYSETTPCNPVLAYERAKLETEALLQKASDKHNLRTLILRLPQIYGSTDDPLIGIINLIRRHIFPVVKGKVGSLPLIHVEDVTEAVCAVLENHSRLSSRFDVAMLCEKSYSYDELARIVRRKYGRGGLLKVPHWFLYDSVRILEVLHSFLGRPEPLNRRRLVSLTKDRIVDCRKFVDTFHFKFERDVEAFLTNELA
jgi:nucleoside-diphosphate-sugar epimerase